MVDEPIGNSDHQEEEGTHVFIGTVLEWRAKVENSGELLRKADNFGSLGLAKPLTYEDGFRIDDELGESLS